MKKQLLCCFLPVLCAVLLTGCGQNGGASSAKSPDAPPEYQLQNGDIVFIPGSAAAGETAEVFILASSSQAAGTRLTVTIPTGSEEATGPATEMGPKTNSATGRFWAMSGGRLIRLKAGGELKDTPYDYQFAYHDVISEASDTSITLNHAPGHSTAGTCSLDFSNACGAARSSDRRTECISVLELAESLLVLDLRAAVLGGLEPAVTTVAQVKSLCEEGVALVNTYAPGGTKESGTAAAILVVDSTPKYVLETVDVSAGSQLNLNKGEYTVGTLNGGGTLAITTETRLTVSGTVKGQTVLQLRDVPYDGAYITAPAATPDNAFTYQGAGSLSVSTDGTTKTWSLINTDVGLTVTVLEGTEFSLFSGSVGTNSGGGGTSIRCTDQSTSNGVTTYYYSRLTPGKYRYSAFMNGYYMLQQNVLYTEEDAQNGRQIDVAMAKKAGNGFEPGSVILPTEQYLTNGIPSDESAPWWDEYSHIFTTPYFLRDKSEAGLHQQTTHQEMLDFIHDLDDANDNMYVFYIGKSPKYEYEFPLVLFTKEDLSGLTLEEAAEVIKADGKPTVHFQGQVHSNEPAAGETALAFIQQADGTYGDQILDTVDLYVIPRVNPDGAYLWQRPSATGGDMNRDYMSMKNEEVQMAVRAYNLFLPEVAIDTHEQQALRQTGGAYRADDVAMNGGCGGARNSQALADLLVEMAVKAQTSVQDAGLRAGWYDEFLYSSTAVFGNAYYGARGSVVFLTETPGIGSGMSNIERRMAGAYIALSTVIDYVAENADEVMKVVNENRADLIAKGAAYEESDLFYLQVGSSVVDQWTTTMVDMTTGEVVDTNHTYGILASTEKDVVNSRPRATAYVIPKDAANIDRILALTGYHGITHYELPAGSTALLKQYIYEDSDLLGEETAVTFQSGAYVFPMSQVAANALGLLMEPDSKAGSDGYTNLLQMGLLRVEDGSAFPLYRCCRDLIDGKIPVENP